MERRSKSRESGEFLFLSSRKREVFFRMAKSIILLSSGRMNRTIILRSLGQLGNAVISNEYTTYINIKDSQGYHHGDDYHDEHYQHVADLMQKIKETQTQGKIHIEHSMAGDLNDEEMSLIRRNMGVLVVVVLRQPEKKFSIPEEVTDFTFCTR